MTLQLLFGFLHLYCVTTLYGARLNKCACLLSLCCSVLKQTLSFGELQYPVSNIVDIHWPLLKITVKRKIHTPNTYCTWSMCCYTLLNVKMPERTIFHNTKKKFLFFKGSLKKIYIFSSKNTFYNKKVLFIVIMVASTSMQPLHSIDYYNLLHTKKN